MKTKCAKCEKYIKTVPEYCGVCGQLFCVDCIEIHNCGDYL